MYLFEKEKSSNVFRKSYNTLYSSDVIEWVKKFWLYKS